MSKLTAAQRRNLPRSAFVFPKARAYPIHDEAHARAALSLAARAGGHELQAVKAAVRKRYPKIGKES